MTEPQHPAQTDPRPRLLSRGSWAETSRIAAVLRGETLCGALLLAATVLAMLWANSPWSDGYTRLLRYTVGPHVLHLDLMSTTPTAPASARMRVIT